MRLASLLLCATLSSTCSYAVALTAPVASHLADDASNLDTPFTLQRDTQVPGKVLKAGGYTLIIKDHLTDRAIIQVRKDDGKIESTFLGVFHSGMESSSNGPISMQIEKGPAALKGFKFPGGGTIEFVYPKAEAAKLATTSPEEVLAIDPASDNLRTTGTNLSTEDAKIVTLWSLQASRVSTGQTSIAAKKYVAAEPRANNVTVAGVQPSAPAVASAPSPAPRPQPVAQRTAPSVRPQPVTQQTQTVAQQPAPAPSQQVATAHRRPKLAALPHTASNLPLMLLAAIFSFSAALITRARGRAAVRNAR